MQLRRGYQFTTGYRLQEYLGKGQFGEVWRASGPGGVDLAVKFIDLTNGRGQKEYAAIKRIKAIQHANLMQITAIWQLDDEGKPIEEAPDDVEQTAAYSEVDSQGQSGFVRSPGPEPATLIVGMRLGDKSLDRYLPEKRASKPTPGAGMPPGDLLKYMEGVARGLDYLNRPIHQLQPGAGLASLQHCDIKPANIVVIGDSAVICDFGLARILSRNQATQTQVAGTPAYMSPEAIEGKPSRHSDQYSLAVTYYHLRTGTLPMDDVGSVYSVLDAHKSGKLNFKDVPSIERKIIERATHLDWQKRYESNTHLVDALRAALQRQGLGSVAAPDVPVVYKGGKAPAQPTGPALDGVGSVDTADLTGPVVGHSKGGSPILSDRGSAKESSDLGIRGLGGIANQTAELPAVDTGADAHEKAVAPEVSPAASGSSPSPATAYPRGRRPFYKSPMVQLGSLAVGVMLPVLLWNVWRAGGDSPPAATACDHYEQAVASLDQDEWETAKAKFAKAVAADPSLGEVPILAYAGHADAVEALQQIADRPLYVTTGYDERPKLWWPDSAAKSPEFDPALGTAGAASGCQASVPLRSRTLAELPDKVLYREAVAVAPGGDWLFIGSGNSLHLWPTTGWTLTESEEPFVQPKTTWQFGSEVLCVSVHPQHTGRAVVALADQSLAVVDAASFSPVDQQTPGTRLADTASQLCFLGGGDWLAVRSEFGKVLVFSWAALAGNAKAFGAVEPVKTDITDAQTIMPFHREKSRLGNSDIAFLVGHQNGAITTCHLNTTAAAESGEEAVWRSVTEDTLHQREINVMDTRGSTNGNRPLVVSGSGDESIAIRNATDFEKAVAIPLSDGPVRSLAVSEDGRWAVAGVNQAVWIVHLDEPQNYQARVSIGDISAESVLIDPERNRLVIGGSDGSLTLLNWNGCRLKAMQSPPPQRPDPAQPPRIKQDDGRFT